MIVSEPSHATPRRRRFNPIRPSSAFTSDMLKTSREIDAVVVRDSPKTVGKRSPSDMDGELLSTAEYRNIRRESMQPKITFCMFFVLPSKRTEKFCASLVRVSWLTWESRLHWEALLLCKCAAGRGRTFARVGVSYRCLQIESGRLGGDATSSSPAPEAPSSSCADGTSIIRVLSITRSKWYRYNVIARFRGSFSSDTPWEVWDASGEIFFLSQD